MVLKVVAGIAIFLPLFIFGTMYLWNWLVPTLFHGPMINFWQTIGLLVLSKILFGGFGKKMGRGGRCGHGGYNGWGGWKQRMNEKMGNMTPEEKEQFQQRLKDKCGSKL